MDQSRNLSFGKELNNFDVGKHSAVRTMNVVQSIGNILSLYESMDRCTGYCKIAEIMWKFAIDMEHQCFSFTKKLH